MLAIVTPLAAYAGCGGEPAKVPVADLLAIAPPSSAQTRLVPAVAAAPQEPPILLAVKIAHPDVTFAVGKGWVPIQSLIGADLRELTDNMVSNWLPADSVAIDRPISMLLVASGSSEAS